MYVVTVSKEIKAGLFETVQLAKLTILLKEPFKFTKSFSQIIWSGPASICAGFSKIIFNESTQSRKAQRGRWLLILDIQNHYFIKNRRVIICV